MALWSVLFFGEHLTSSTTAEMRSHTLSPVKDLYSGRCGSHFHQLLDQRVRHAVEVAVEGDVIVDVHAGSGPLAHVEPFGRQRTQCAAFEQFPNRAICFVQSEELVMT